MCPAEGGTKAISKYPVIPFGIQGFGNHFGFVSDDDACKLIRRAVDIGVNHFDCALCYGNSVRKLGLLTGIDLSDRDQNNPEVARATQMRQWCSEQRGKEGRGGTRGTLIPRI